VLFRIGFDWNLGWRFCLPCFPTFANFDFVIKAKSRFILLLYIHVIF
jgi:hypothetical protein